MPYDIVITDNNLSAVCQEIRNTATMTLKDAGELFQQTARKECPVSAINEPGYVHLWETIGYEVEEQGTDYQQWLTMYVGKDYAILVNDGTSRMPARPFFTDGVIAVQDNFEGVVRARFRDLMQGRYVAPSNRINDKGAILMGSKQL